MRKNTESLGALAGLVEASRTLPGILTDWQVLDDDLRVEYVEQVESLLGAFARARFHLGLTGAAEREQAVARLLQLAEPVRDRMGLDVEALLQSGTSVGGWHDDKPGRVDQAYAVAA